MSERDSAIPLRHMRDAANRAIEIAGALARENLTEDKVETLALTRLLEIIGEAARRVPEAFRIGHPAIPWREITGTRDRLIHGYDRVDLDILWTIVREQLPLLVAQLNDVLRGLGAR
jgi:uncharacterized protein with HEPN domain